MWSKLLRRGLSVVFQPIFDLRTGATLGYEALGRVDRRIVDWGPEELLDAARARGRLLQVDRRLRALAIEEIGRHRPPSDLSFFLNIDTRVVDDPAFAPGYTGSLCEAHGVAPESLVFELCERDPALATGRLEWLVRHYGSQGYRIALDDFGAGYASLGAVARLHPGIIKIDKTVVRDVGESAIRFELCRALAGLGQATGIQIVAEGIQTPREHEALLAAGVGLGQGYLLGIPRELGIHARRWPGRRPLAAGSEMRAQAP